MPYRLPRHNVTPNLRPDHCLICHRPLTQARVGRPRHTCGPTCRQALYRHRYNVYNPDDKRWRASDRRADVELARMERRFGPFDDQPRDGGLSLRQRIRYRLSRGIPLLRCKTCGKPFTHDVPAGLGVRYCSRRCKAKYVRRYRRLRKAVYGLHNRPLTETAIHAITRDLPYEFCAHCEMPFVPNPAARKPSKYCSQKCRQSAYYRRNHPAILRRAACAHCGKRFAVHAPRHKYCSARCEERAGWRRRYEPHRKSRFWGVCSVCGIPIENQSNGGHARQYCSKRCNLTAFRMRKKQRAEQALGRQARRCAWCGDLLGWQAHARAKYCSKTCRRKMDIQNNLIRQRARRAARPPVERACAACGQIFVVRPHAGDRHRFCSVKCRSRVWLAARRAIPAPTIFLLREAIAIRT